MAIVLIAEDDEGVRTMLVSALSKLGYSVLTADSGSKALQTYGRDEAPAVEETGGKRSDMDDEIPF